MAQYNPNFDPWPPAEFVQVYAVDGSGYDFTPLGEAVTRRQCPCAPVPTYKSEEILEFMVWGPGPLKIQIEEEE